MFPFTAPNHDGLSNVSRRLGLGKVGEARLPSLTKSWLDGLSGINSTMRRFVFKNKLVSQYHKTLLGNAWAILAPLTHAIVSMLNSDDNRYV